MSGFCLYRCVSLPPYTLISRECALCIRTITNCDVNNAVPIIVVINHYFLIYAYHFSLEAPFYPMHKCLALLQNTLMSNWACCVDTTRVLRSTSLQKFMLAYLWHWLSGNRKLRGSICDNLHLLLCFYLPFTKTDDDFNLQGWSASITFMWFADFTVMICFMLKCCFKEIPQPFNCEITFLCRTLKWMHFVTSLSAPTSSCYLYSSYYLVFQKNRLCFLRQ